MMTTLAADLHNRLFQALEEKKVALARFQWSCYADDPITPKDTMMTLFPTDCEQRSTSEAHLGFFNSQASEARAILNVERSRFFPELSIGYSRQDILPLKNLPATKKSDQTSEISSFCGTNTGRSQHPRIEQ